MTAQRAITLVEIDIPYCTLSYGVAPCTAVLGVDSEVKCWNTFSTCAKREDFDEGAVTLRFAKAATYLDESGIDAIPSIIDARYEPAELSLGEPSLGVRAKLSVTLSDHPYGDTGEGFDKYRTERTYDPAKTGTFWGKFRARHPVLKGRPIRLIRGFVGQTLEEMETRHLFVDSTDTDEDGRFTITGKDVIKLADGDRALAPTPSKGYLVADITAGATSATLAPSGIGNAEYPSSGHLAIGGSEIVAFTRSGDTLTLTRGQFGTEAQSHSAQDRAQVCLYYQGVDPADIIEDLFTTYANIPDAQIPLADWKDETAAYLRRVYTAMIAEPTPVRDLVSELVEQAALVLIPDDITQTIRLQVLRTINTDAAIWSEENIGKGTLRIKDQPAKRITNCITYYGLINPLENVDDPKNYRSIEAYDATDFDVENQPTIKRIFSRWIPAFGRTVAERLNLIQIGRYQSAPRAFSFDVFRDRDPQLGTGYLMSSWPMQLASGERDQVPMQITRMRPGDAWLSLEGEEVRFLDLDEQDLTNRVIIIDGSANNINLRSIHDSLFPPLTEGDEITFIVNSGVVVGSTSTGSPAMHVGTWPAGFVPLVQVRGRIQGRAGNGGRGGQNGGNGASGGAGGRALYTRSPITLELLSGAQIWGGGGGGGGGGSRFGARGGGGGGGGAGTLPGSGGAGGSGQQSGQPGKPGTATAGGAGGAGAYSAGDGRAGGGPGQSGTAGQAGYGTSGGAGGAAGSAIDGVSYITITGSGDLRGPQVN
ncbi:MAG: hypothetical protein CML24_11425 [Rhizobiales bacterium]|nr:hypothetical protein [Hyphomicrobiales bacterium]